MAVYTDVPSDALDAFLTDYDLGHALSFKGIAEGVENSNFLLRTTQGGFFLTLYEKRVAEADLPFFLALLDHLAAKGVACPLPVKAKDGQALRRLCGRPAAIVTLLDGVSVREGSPELVHAVGCALAGLHLAGADFKQSRANALSLDGWRNLARQIGARANEIEAGLEAEIADTLGALSQTWPKDLPQGLIHADLFPDNVLVVEGRVSGLIDFYFACTDALVYDLVVTLNAWCFDAAHRFDPGRAKALLAGYESLRPLTRSEHTALPVLARGAALRFLLTRLYDWLNQVPGALVRPKDPLEYLVKMRFHATPSAW